VCHARVLLQLWATNEQTLLAAQRQNLDLSRELKQAALALKAQQSRHDQESKKRDEVVIKLQEKLQSLKSILKQ
jgi:hypothetical protein